MKQSRLAVKNWQWNADREKAARLVAEGELTIQQIADQLSIDQSRIDAWKRAPEFAMRVAETIDAYREHFLRRGLACKERRLAKLSGIYQKLELEVAARGADMRRRKVAVGKTGLVAESWKQIGGGEDAQLVSEYTIDAATSREMRGVLQQIATELGQWSERREVTGPNGGAIQVEHSRKPDLRNLSDAELVIYGELVTKLIAQPERDSSGVGEPEVQIVHPAGLADG